MVGRRAADAITFVDLQDGALDGGASAKAGVVGLTSSIVALRGKPIGGQESRGEGEEREEEMGRRQRRDRQAMDG